MKNTKFLSAAAAILALLGSAADSCKKDNTEPEVGKGTVSGVVTNNLGTPIIDVEVSISGTEIKATTSVDGSYTLENVPMTKQTVFFKKEGYAEGSSPINASSFKDGKATVDMVMDIASAKITGKCIDAKNNNAGNSMEPRRLRPMQTASMCLMVLRLMTTTSCSPLRDVSMSCAA